MTAAVEELAGKPEERARLAEAAREYAIVHWGRDAVLGKFAKELEKVARAGNRR